MSQDVDLFLAHGHEVIRASRALRAESAERCADARSHCAASTVVARA